LSRNLKPSPLGDGEFTNDFEACIAYLRPPIGHRRAIHATNLLERLIVEERRRLKIISDAFGENPVLKLVFGAMIRAAERWRAIGITTLERRQLDALRNELDHDYKTETCLSPSRSAADPHTRISSSSGTRPRLDLRRPRPLQPVSQFSSTSLRVEGCRSG
jgi:putative transposase